MSYSFRFTLRNAVEDAAVLSWLQSAAPGHLVVRHDADAEVKHAHWHAILHSAKTVQTLRQGFRRVAPDCPKAGYSLGVIKPGEEHVYERYMCHGAQRGDPVVIVSSEGLKYTQAWAQEQNAAFYDARAAFAARVKAKPKTSTIEELLEECKAQSAATRDHVIAVIIPMFARQNRAMIESYMKACVTTVCVKLGIESETRSLADRLKIFSW